ITNSEKFIVKVSPSALTDLSVAQESILRILLKNHVSEANTATIHYSLFTLHYSLLIGAKRR
ncbi:MAG: hypothetical protein ILA17_03350, partial [Ruminococcus sp.]|nr:hypothetical protein [Ruminococcus sp.]